MKAYWSLPVWVLVMISAAQAETTIYGAANANTFVNSNDAGTSLGIDGGLSHFGFRGEREIDASINAIFDARFYANTVGGVRNDGQTVQGFPQVLRGHVGIEGDFGIIRLFGGPSPLTKTQSYLNLMEEDPINFQNILGDGMLTPSAALPTGAKFRGYNTGINFTSNDLGGGLSFDGAVLPAQNPNGETGISLAATMAQDAFSVSGAFEVNGANSNTQLFRLVGEYYLNEITLGGLLQFAGNADQDLNGTSFVGFAELPVDIARWTTRLRLTGGFSAQENDAETIEESQTLIAAMHEVRFSNQVSAYNFGEVFLPDDSAGNNTRFGTGLQIRF